jgi:DNA-binding transcriptional LysR family regulator
MDKSEVTLERMRTFVRVAERGSLSAVARELGVGQSTITRHLRELEEALGVPLLSRTTRRMALTSEGSRYYANAVQILRLVEQAGDEARNTRGSPAGTIRISCTAAIGVLHITRLIFAFQDRYPDIGVDLSLHSLPTVPLNLLILPERANIARVRLLVDFLADQVRTIPGVEKTRPAS